MTDRPPPAPPSESPLQERLRILRESTGSATLTPNAETYVKRAAELVHNEEGPVGQTPYDRRLRPAGAPSRSARRPCGPVAEIARVGHGGGRRDDSARTRRKI